MLAYLVQWNGWMDGLLLLIIAFLYFISLNQWAIFLPKKFSIKVNNRKKYNLLDTPGSSILSLFLTNPYSINHL